MKKLASTILVGAMLLSGCSPVAQESSSSNVNSVLNNPKVVFAAKVVDNYNQVKSKYDDILIKTTTKGSNGDYIKNNMQSDVQKLVDLINEGRNINAPANCQKAYEYYKEAMNDYESSLTLFIDSISVMLDLKTEEAKKKLLDAKSERNTADKLVKLFSDQMEIDNK